MARFVLFRGLVATNLPGSVSKSLTGSILKKILMVAGCVVAFAWVQTAVAQAPHGGGHVGGGGHAGGGARGGGPVRGAVSRAGVFVWGSRWGCSAWGGPRGGRPPPGFRAG